MSGIVGGNYWRGLNGDFYRDVDEGEGTKIGPNPTGTFGWRDITGAIEVRFTGSNNPTWAQIGATAFRAFQFAVNDECWINFHVPHDYVPGTDIYLHAHWIADGTDTNPVKWEWTAAYADGFAGGAFNFASPTTTTAQEAAAGTAYTHQITETAGITISGMEVDGLLHVRVRRITNGATDNTDGIFLLTSDIHYQSTNLPTKNKAPDFYT